MNNTAMIIYYSRSGNTEKLAGRIKEDLNCSIVKIIPEEAYGNYISSCLRVTKEKKQAVAPTFVTPIPDLTNCKVVLIGFPIWAQDLPRFVQEFVSRCDLKGKTVIPFATFGISGLSWTKKTLERICNGAEVKLCFDYGMFKKDDYGKWILSVKKEIENE